MSVELSRDEINTILSAIGLALSVITDPEARKQLEELQTKLMDVRGDDEN